MNKEELEDVGIQFAQEYLGWLLKKWLSTGLAKDKIEYVEICSIYDYSSEE